ncbi:MAG: zinc-binding dehydrogenase [Nitrospinae bacterium]|nr:zinc-binding dehydrogenase [Nitrospinota bacterium]
MKAVRFTGEGALSSIRVENLPDPLRAEPGRVVVRVMASSLNHMDLYSMSRGDGLAIPGSDGAGVVEYAGAGVTDFVPGDEVIINPNIGEPDEDNYTILGSGANGTHAEFISLPSRNLLKKPSSLSFEEAAALPLCLMTAWRQVVVKGAARPGEWVLIHGAGGGVSVYAMQIAALCGASVIVTSGDEAKLGKAALLGATHTLNHRHTDIVAEVADITGGHGADVVIDNVGAETFPTSLAVAATGGRIVMSGNVSSEQVSFHPAPLYWKGVTVMGSLMGRTEELEKALALAAEGKIRPVIDSVFDLSDYRMAMERMVENRHFGKIIIGR